MDDQGPIAAIILAAGTSSRMGPSHKLLLPLKNRPILEYALTAALASQADPIVVVLGYQADLVRTALEGYLSVPAITWVENPHYLQGMSSSLHVGIQTLLNVKKHPQCDGAMILLGDQPLISSEVINRLIKAKYQTHQRIVVPFYAGKRGNPALFEKSIFPELLATTGDEGGRSVIQQHPHDVAMVEMEYPGMHMDIDTWEDYQWYC
jgi:molybdenum cofactor cytidylyltransferase